MPNLELSVELSDIVVTSLLKDKVDEPILNRVRDPVNLEFHHCKETGELSEPGIADIFVRFRFPIL